jgi:hypothetical protein
MFQVLRSEDGYWIYQYSEILFNGYFGIPINIQESNRLKSIWKDKSIDPMNYFHPSIITDP